MVMCLGQSADLHMAQLMPLPLTYSCSRLCVYSVRWLPGWLDWKWTYCMRLYVCQNVSLWCSATDTVYVHMVKKNHRKFQSWLALIVQWHFCMCYIVVSMWSLHLWFVHWVGFPLIYKYKISRLFCTYQMWYSSYPITINSFSLLWLQFITV